MTEQDKKKQTIEWIVTGIAMLIGLYNQIAITKGWAHIQVGDSQLTLYVTWFYELVVGAIAFWRNNNITSPAQLVQVLLDKIKQGLLSNEQMQVILKIAEMLINKELTIEQLDLFLNDNSLREIANAHLNGETVDVNITEGV